MTRSRARVGVLLVIQDLVFEADHILLAFRRAVLTLVLERCIGTVFELGAWPGRVQQKSPILNAIFHTAVAAGSDLPVEHQLKISEGLGSEKVLLDARMRHGLQAAIFDAEG